MLLAIYVINRSKSKRVDTHVRTQTKIVTLTAVRTATRLMWKNGDKNAVVDVCSSTAPTSAKDTVVM